MKRTLNNTTGPRHGLKLVPKKPAIPLPVFPDYPELGPFPLADYDSKLSTPWGKAIAHELLSEQTNARIANLREYIRTINIRIEKLAQHGVSGGMTIDVDWLFKSLDPSLKLLIAVEKQLQKNKVPTDKEWAAIIAPYLDEKTTRSSLTIIGKHLQLPPVSVNAWNEAKYLRAKEKFLAIHGGAWIGPVLADFLKYIEDWQKNYEDKNYVGKDLRFTGKTKLTCLYVATRILIYLQEQGLIDIKQMRQHHFDEFYCRNKIAASFANYFVKFLNKKGWFTFSFTAPKTERLVDLRNLVPQEEIEAITGKLLAEKNYLQESLLAIFTLYYGQTPHQCIKMPMTTLDTDSDGAMTIRFNKVDIPLHPAVAVKLREWLVVRDLTLAKHGIKDHPLIFFDNKNPMVPINIEHLPRQLGIKLNFKRARATAIVNLYFNGVRSARALMDTIGVSLNTAMAYMNGCAALYLGQADPGTKPL